MVFRLSICAIILLMFQLPIHAKSHHPQEFLQSISGSKNVGEEIYNHFCVNCHAIKPLIPMGAPRVAVQADWALRVQQGMKVLFQHTNEGLNAMPPRGGCFECTDKQLMLAIHFMIKNQAENNPRNKLRVHKKDTK